MKVKEMIDSLRSPVKIEFRNVNDEFICLTESNSEGVIPYIHRSVFEWLPSYNISDRKIYVWLKDESGDAE